MICASEQAVLVDKEVYQEFEKLMREAGCYFVSPEEKQKLQESMFEYRDDIGYKLKSTRTSDNLHIQLQKKQVLVFQKTQKC